MQRVNSEPWLSRHVWVGVISEHSGPPFSNLFPVCFTLFGQKNYLNKRLWFMCTRAHYRSCWGKKTEEKERERIMEPRRREATLFCVSMNRRFHHGLFTVESQQIDFAKKKMLKKQTLWPFDFKSLYEKFARNIVLFKLCPTCKRREFLTPRQARPNQELSTIIFPFAVY